MVLIVTGLSLKAQLPYGSLRVSVNDEIKDVHIVVKKNGDTIEQAFTDQFGFVLLTQLEPGVYEVEASHLSYRSVLKKVAISSNNITLFYPQLEVELVWLFVGKDEMVVYNRPIIALNPFGGPDTWKNCNIRNRDRL